MREADIAVMTPAERAVYELLGDRVWQAKAILGPPRTLLDTPLERFGLKALDQVEIVIAAEQRFGVEIHDEQIPAPLTVRTLAGTIDQILATRSATP